MTDLENKENEMANALENVLLALKQRFDAAEETNCQEINAVLKTLKKKSLDEISNEINTLRAKLALRLDEELTEKVKKLNELLAEDEEYDDEIVMFAGDALGKAFAAYDLAKTVKSSDGDLSFKELTDLDEIVGFYLCLGREMRYVTQDSVKLFVQKLVDEVILDEEALEIYQKIF